jgi:RimJ/RimL family protein N-acetyltransferase
MKHVFDKVIEGEFITLRQVRVSDATDIFNWRTSSAGKYLHQPENYSIESQENWIKTRPDDEMNYIIHPKNDTIKVGMIAIHELNYADLVGCVGRLILDEQYVNKGTPYGLEALLLTYDYLFNTMNFRKMTGVILGRNEKVFKLQSFLGMEQEGYLKKHAILNGGLEDLYVMSLFKEDFWKYKESINKILNKFRQ